MKTKAPKAAPRENPLVPFALLKHMYAGMVETRLLEAHLAKRPDFAVEGQEACRAAVLLNLEAGDLIADRSGAPSSAWLRGADLSEAVEGRATGLLPAIDDAAGQVAMAVGAAAVVRQAKLSRVVVVFLYAGTKRAALRSILPASAESALPLVFVIPPPPPSGVAKDLAAEATRFGVPSIPVEAHDAVAICRVAQESILRARAGGGPALIECVRLDDRAPDPIAALGTTLLRLGACDRAWLRGVAPAFKARLKALKRERSA